MPSDERLRRLSEARLYLVCDSRPGGRALAEVLGGALAGGVDMVQLRDKRLGDDALAEVAREAGALCARAGALLIVNDRPLVAQAAGADGVHVGQEDMPVAEVRALVGEDLLIGLSTHTPAQIDAAGHTPEQIDGAGQAPAQIDAAAGHAGAATDPASQPNTAQPDYIGVGPVHATPTKPGRPAVGLDLVRYAAHHAPKPFFAIGGIDMQSIGAVLGAGATRVAVVRAIAEAQDPELAARTLRAALTREADVAAA